MKSCLPALPLLLLAASCATTPPASETLASARRDAALAGGSPLVTGGGPVASVATAQHQEDPTRLVRLEGPLDLAGAVEIGLTNNLTLLSQKLKREQALGAVDEAYGAAYPGIAATGSLASDLVDRDQDVQPDRMSVGLALTQPLYRSGVVSKGVEYAKYYSAFTDLAIQNTEQEIVYQIASQYLTVLLEQHLVTVYEESLGTAERLLETTRNRRAAGSASQYEQLRAEVEVSTANASLIGERNRLNTAWITLFQLLGVDQSSSVSLTDDLAYVARSFSSDEAIAAALEHRPDLAQAEANVRMAELELEITKGQYGPTVDAFVKGEYATANPNDPTDDDWGFDASAGLSANYSLYDGTTKRGKIRQARSKLAQAEAALREAEENARVAVIAAVLSVKDADELFLSQQKNIETSREATRMVESGFKQGRNTQVEVLDAQSALTKAMGTYYSAIRSHSLACLGVRKAVGELSLADVAGLTAPAAKE